jgi:uncharacterized protein YcbX
MAIVKELYFYPIKSFRGLRVSQLELTPQGPRWDREWMLVDEGGRFLTQRQMPHLARIGLRMDEEAGIELTRADLGSVDFGLEEREGDPLKVVVWKSEVPAQEVSSEVSSWLSEACGQKVRLVRLSPEARREFAAESMPGRTVRFVDACPLLVTSTASLKGLEQKAGVTLSMSRFRPNIVVDGVSEHDEDVWGGFKIGRIDFQGIKKCGRCKITTVHPLTGEVGEEPLKTLATYRREEKGVYFGYYYAHMSEGRIAVNDPVVLS